MYLYKTIIYKIPNEVIGLSGEEIIQHGEDKTDFEANFKSSAVRTDRIVIAETTFEINKTYQEFKSLTNVLTWGDVKYIEIDGYYSLYLLTDTPI